MARVKPLVVASGQVQQLPTGDFVDLGKLNIEPRDTITSAATITVSSSFIRMRNTSGSTVNVDQINGGDRGDVLFIMRRNNDDNTRFRKGNGNIRGGNDRVMRSRDDTLLLLKINNTTWNEISWQG